MLAIRLFIFTAAAIFATSAVAQTVIPYAGVGIGGANNVYDIDLTMCRLTAANTDPNDLPGFSGGCVDRLFGQCAASPTSFCQVRSIPAGRCANGAIGTGCLWNDPNNTAAFRCDGNIGIQCVTDAECPGDDTCDIDNSAGNGASPAQVAACLCTSATEQSVCGPDDQARCSDGDPTLAFGDGHGGGLCTHSITSPTAAPGNCGLEAGSNQALTGPRKPGWENAPSAVTPQRDPGTGLGQSGEILEAEATYGVVLGNADATHGIRRYSSLGKVFFADFFYADGDVGGGSVDAIIAPQVFNPPLGWTTENLIGQCTAGSTGSLCLTDVDCGVGGGSCANKVGAYARAVDSVGFIFTADVAATGACPPDCGLDYDHHTYEQQMIEAVGVADFEAGVQLSFDSLQNNRGDPNSKAGAGDAIAAASVWVPVWLNNDVRCFIGGDPARFDAGTTSLGTSGYPNASAIGRCDVAATSVPCDPATEGAGTNHCGGAVCRYCGGTHTSFDATWGTAAALPAGYNTPPVTCAAGFDCSVLDLTERLGGLNGVTYDLKVPLAVITTTGLTRAEVIDATCPTLSGQSTCTTAGGGVTPTAVNGIDAVNKTTGLRSYVAGFAYPAFSAAFGGAGQTNDTGSSITWAAQYAGHVPGVGASTGDWGPGANGIPGCIGDNQNGIGSPPCSAGGGGLAPGTGDPGSDDVQVYSVDLDADGTPTNALSVPRLGDPGTGSTPIPNPNAGDASASGLPGSVDDPSGAPTLRLVGAGSVIDLNVLSSANNNDSLFNVHTLWCPVRPDPSDPNVAIRDCWYDADEDGIDDTFDNCLGVANGSQTDTDSDGIGDDCDNCPTVANADQADGDTAIAAGDTINTVAGPDGVGDACDNCVFVTNAPITKLLFQTVTGSSNFGSDPNVGQLDDDADGFGNHCDADFNNVDNLINPTDLALFLAANGKKRNKAVCSGGDCDIYDINGVDNLINASDLARFLQLNGTKKGKKQWVTCAACPLP